MFKIMFVLLAVEDVPVIGDIVSGAGELLDKAKEAITNLFTSLGDFFLGLVPSIDPFAPLSVPTLIEDIVYALDYLLPMDTIFILISLSAGITLLRIAYSGYLVFRDLFNSGGQKLFKLLGFFTGLFK